MRSFPGDGEAGFGLPPPQDDEPETIGTETLGHAGA
jgi:hypothetical protein